MATGNSKAAKSARVKLQLRDKKGRWIEMGGGVKWYSPNLKKYMFGTAIDATPDGKAVVEVKIPDPSGKGKETTTTVNIVPSQLEKIKSKATIPSASNDVIAPELSKPSAEVKPQVDKSNELFKKVHQNPATHAEPFGPDYEQAPADTKLEKGDYVVLYSEGTTSKGQITGFDPASKNPLVQKETSPTWGFSGDSYIINPKNIAKVFKAVPSSPTNSGDDKKAKVDVPVPAPTEIKQGGFLNKPAQKDPVAEKAAAEAKVKAAAEADMAKQAELKVDKLQQAASGSKLISNDDDGETVNLTKHAYGYWSDNKTGTNYTATEVTKNFKGNKNLSIIEPITEEKDTDPKSDMTSEQWKKTLDAPQLMELNDAEESSPYLVTEAPYKNFPGFNMAEEEAIIEYVQDSTPINSALRKNTKYALEDNKKIIAGLDSVLDKSVLAESTTVYRGVRVTGDMFDAMSNHGIYHDKGFSSTTSKKSIAQDWVSSGNWGDSKAVVLQINMPAGFKAHKIDYAMGKSNGWGIENYDSEEEVILPRNTAFKVISITKDSYFEKYHAIVEPVLTNHNSKEGTTNDGNTGNNTGGDGSGQSNTGPAETKSSEQIHSGTGGDNNVNSGGSGSDGGGAEQSSETGPKQDNQAGLVTEAPAEPQELGKLYTDAQGQYMAGTDGQKFRKGDTVSYTKKGVTQEGKVIALYEGVKSARVEWPDGTNSIKKINTLKNNSKGSEGDTAPVQSESAPAINVPETNLDSIEYESPVPFNGDIASPDKLPIGTKLELNANKNFKAIKTGENTWSVGDDTKGNTTETYDSSIAMAQGLKNQGKPSYNIYMPKNTSPEETANPSVDATDAVNDFEKSVSDVSEIPNFGEEAKSSEEVSSVKDYTVVVNDKGADGVVKVKPNNGKPFPDSNSTLEVGDKIYPIGTMSKPYSSGTGQSAEAAFINTSSPAGIGTVINTHPNKPYLQVQGEDGNDYFPSKQFMALKQNSEIDKALGKAPEVDPEEIPTPEEVAELDIAAESPKGPVDVSSWKKIKSSSGSNPGGEYEAPDGTHYFIKQSKSDLHAKNEVFASDIYQAAGVNSLELGYSDVDGSGKLGTIAPMLTGSKDNFQSKLDDPEYRKEFQKGWAVDAWLGNWDVVGLSYDNALTDADGKAIRVDPGGALLFRAMGSPKTDAMFSDKVTEWDSMRTDPNNYQTYNAFNDMTDAQIKESVAIVAGFSDKMIDDLIDKHDFDAPTANKLKTRLKNRRDDLIKRADALPGGDTNTKDGQEEPLADWEKELLDGAIEDSKKNEETTNEDISSTSKSNPNQEALDALKKKLQEDEGTVEDLPVDDSEGEWSSIDNAISETFDVANAKPGTVFKNDKGQDAVVGKYNSVVEYGASVEYTKKGETKTGTVSNMMPNQQSAKVLWSDGSSSIIKGSQLYAKKNSSTSNSDKASEAPIVNNLDSNEKVVSHNNKDYVVTPWNGEAIDAASLPDGSIIGKNIEAEGNYSYGYIKKGPNNWSTYVVSEKKPGYGSYIDNDFNVVKNDDYTLYTPKDSNVPTSDNTEVNNSSALETDSLLSNDMVTKSLKKFVGNGNKVDVLPVGTKIYSNKFGKFSPSYTKTGINQWKSEKNPGFTPYTDSDIQSISFAESNHIVLPEDQGKTWWNTGSAYAKLQPIGTKISKGSVTIQKDGTNDWNSNIGFNYTDAEINAFQPGGMWVLHAPEAKSESPKENKKNDFDNMINQIEAQLDELSSNYQDYVDQNEEYASWDAFAMAHEDGLIDLQENNILIGEKAYKVIPTPQHGPAVEVEILNEQGQTIATLKAGKNYGSFDKYLLEKNLEEYFAKKLQENNVAAIKEDKPASDNSDWSTSNGLKAEKLPVGSTLQYSSTVLTKENDNYWSTPNGSQYDNGTVDNLKDAGWKLTIPENSADSTTTETVKDLTEEWGSKHPAAVYMPIGSFISNKNTPSVQFTKIAQDQWQAKAHPSIKHTNKTMDDLKNSQWNITIPNGSTVEQPKPEEKKNSGSGMTADQFTSVFDNYLDDLSNNSWASAKSIEQSFETEDGTKFVVKPHPMSTTYFKSLQLSTADGEVVPTDIELTVSDDFTPVGYGPKDLFKIAEDFANKKNSKNQSLDEEYALESGIGLDQVSYSDFVKVPAGTKINYMVNGKIHGTFLKNSNNTWRYQETKKEKPSHKSETNANFQYLMENNKSAAANYVMVAPEVVPQLEEIPEDKPEESKYHLQGVKFETVDELDAYPTGTVVKFEQSAWNNNTNANFFVKQEDGTWTHMKKTAATLTEKKSKMSSAAVFSNFKSWYTNPAAVSIPSSADAVMLGNGEHAYVGDVVLHSDNGGVYTIEKINKTGINVKDVDGNKLKFPSKKLYKNADFGVKQTSASTDSYGSKYDTSTNDPLSAWVDSVKAEQAIKDKLANFAGASAAEYDEKGLGLNVSPDAAKPKNLGLSVIEVEEGNTKHPLYGTPKPQMPTSPDEYPSFEESVLDNLPKWDSSAWLKKVEDRYKANPNKKFDSVQKSTQWNKIEEVLKGNEGYKSYLNQLLSNKYVDQDLFDEAEKAIKAQELANKPLKKAHQENIAKEKAEYDAKKTEYMAEYNSKLKDYTETLEEWSKVNVNAKAVKKLPKIPPLSMVPFTGGPADWTKAHPGTFSVQTAMDAIREDNYLARFGLGTAVDGDKIEETSVVFNRVLDTNGVEKFEVTFKLTNAFGALMNNKLKADPSVSKSTGIYYNKKTNMLGKPDDQLAKLDGKPSNSNFVNSGNRYEYTDPNGAKVVFQHATQEGQNVSVNHNAVQILLPKDATPADFQLALEGLGIDAKPSTAGALRVVAENKLLTLFSGESNWGDQNFSGEKRQKALEKIKKEFNITVDDVVVENDANGRLKFFLTDAKVTEFMSKSKIKEFKHSVYAGEDIDVWESLLAGTNPGLTSSYFRGNNGIGELKSSSGMSPDKDMAVGSGNGIFITPHASKETSAPYYNWIGLDVKAIMRRLDMWGNAHDNYGKNDKGAQTPFQMMKTMGGFHEVMPRDGIPVSDFAWVSLGSSQAKKELIKRLSDRGIYMINGVPLEKFILTNHEEITPLPQTVNTPGAGIAPSGAAAV